MFKERFGDHILRKGLKVQTQWVGKNVNLTLLSEYVEDFFKGRGFKTKRDESAEEYTVSGIPQRAHGIYGKVCVRILGSSNDFVIEFLPSQHTRSAIRAGFITTMFGGGALLLRGLKSQEELERLENEFWEHVEEDITRLVDSAKQPYMKLP